MLLVTGAAGFIGSAIAWALNQRGRQDLVLCDHRPEGLKRRNLTGLRHARYVERDELFAELAGAAWAREITDVLHIGARTDTTETDEAFLTRVNTDYSRQLCDWALEREARFIYASSAAVYGDGTLGFSDADTLTPTLKPLNAYGRSKWRFDMQVIEQGLINRVVGLRFFNVFGPNEYHKGPMASVVFRAFPHAQQHGTVRLFQSHRPDYKDGEQARDFISVKDVVKATLYFLDHPAKHGIFNLGTGRARTFNDLATALLKALGRPPRLEYFPTPENIRATYQYHTEAVLDRLRNAGFTEPFTSLEAAIGEYVTRYLAPGMRLLQEAEGAPGRQG